MRAILTGAALCCFLARTWVVAPADADQAADKAPQRHPLRLLFLGEPGSARSEVFRTFLTERFASVRVADRWTWDRALLKDADVVVLDWPQQDGVSTWMLKGDRTVTPVNPLGAREQWNKPTLLLGSAGLNVAWAWGVKGSFG